MCGCLRVCECVHVCAYMCTNRLQLDAHVTVGTAVLCHYRPVPPGQPDCLCLPRIPALHRLLFGAGTPYAGVCTII